MFIAVVLGLFIAVFFIMFEIIAAAITSFIPAIFVYGVISIFGTYSFAKVWFSFGIIFFIFIDIYIFIKEGVNNNKWRI
jgi:hypothetical protein